MHAETVVDGIAFGEGPVWCDDGTLAVTSVAEGVPSIPGFRVALELHRVRLASIERIGALW